MTIVTSRQTKRLIFKNNTKTIFKAVDIFVKIIIALILDIKYPNDRPVGQAETRSSLKREICGLYLGPVKSGEVLPAARHHCDISLKAAR